MKLCTQASVLTVEMKTATLPTPLAKTVTRNRLHLASAMKLQAPRLPIQILEEWLSLIPGRALRVLSRPYFVPGLERTVGCFTAG